MTLRISYAGSLLVLTLLGCGDDDVGDKIGTLDRGAVLGDLDESEQQALCDVTEQIREESTADAEGRRSACFLQLVGDVDTALFNVELDPDRFTVDAVIADCEAALDRCRDEGPKRAPCERVEFEPSCSATVDDYARCLEGTMASSRTLAAIDCETYVRSEAERERRRDEALAGLKSCIPVLSCKSEVVPDEDDESWFDGSVGEVGVDAGSVDTRANAQWIAEIDDAVRAFERPECEGPLQHAPELDGTAAVIASEPFETQHELAFTAEWKWISAPHLEDVLERIQLYLEASGSTCSWQRYGLGVAGEPGENRQVVLLIAE